MKNLAILFALACVTLSGCANTDDPRCESETAEEGCGFLPPPAPQLAQGESCGEASCDEAPPECPDNLVPAIDESGCYTGGCYQISVCDVTPPCAVLNMESQCEDRAECTSVYGGINCRNPEGEVCASGDAANCTCESFMFASCTEAQ